MFLKKKPGSPSAANDRLARTIAAQVLKWQMRLAVALNARINRYSKRRQKWLFLFCCGTFAAGLIISLWLKSGRIACSMPGLHDQLVHIGLPSERPFKAKPIKPTDSLTIQK